ncbi:MAG: repair protein RecN [Frankiaceae bacterium]|jgi:DNA repair protein RecN (Recombination protein N)|nr:repair protein RecN [Frankiaceae bacterium]
MLEEMRIQALGVIDDAVLEFAPGLTVVTGETGAGKTMVVQGLQLLFGARADGALVRSGADRAVVEGRLRVPTDGEVARRVAEAGGSLDDGELVVARAVLAEGRSRAHVGGRAVPVSVLSELADELLAVHAQSDQRRLLRPQEQLDALDRYAGLAERRAAVAELHDRHVEVSTKLSELVTQARDRALEAEMLRHGLGEIERVAPVDGEDEALVVEIERLTHADDLAGGAAGATEALVGGDAADSEVDALTLVAQARRLLEPLRPHDPELAGLADRLAEVTYQLTDVAADIASYAAGVETDPLRLASAHDRRAALAGLTRRYGDDLRAVIEWSRRSAARLAELESDDDTIEELRGELSVVRERLTTAAVDLSAARRAAARRFGAAVTAELAGLAMPKAVVEVSVRQTPDPAGVLVDGVAVRCSRAGIDDVELQLAAHPGAQLRPVAKAASGGELSRVMLAIEVIFAGATGIPTYVFDEVDAGVGGKAAVEVGRRLAQLARTAQVIVVTHLPQVAAFADRHLHVAKNDDGLVTRTSVTALDDAARVDELSRMLAGLEASALAHGHAEELLALAASTKAG